MVGMQIFFPLRSVETVAIDFIANFPEFHSIAFGLVGIGDPAGGFTGIASTIACHV